MAVKPYELIIIFPPGEQDEGYKALKDIFRRHSVVVLKTAEWGEKPLPHNAKKFDRGYFLFQTCNIKPSELTELNHDMEINPKILRHMLKRAF